VTHTYIKPTSNQRPTTSRVASAAGRLRSSPLGGNAAQRRTTHSDFVEPRYWPTSE